MPIEMLKKEDMKFIKARVSFIFSKTYYEVSVVPAFCVTSQLVPPDLCPEIPVGILPSSQTAHHWRLVTQTIL
jgi:hypothetical protein